MGDYQHLSGNLGELASTAGIIETAVYYMPGDELYEEWRKDVPSGLLYRGPHLLSINHKNSSRNWFIVRDLKNLAEKRKQKWSGVTSPEINDTWVLEDDMEFYPNHSVPGIHTGPMGEEPVTDLFIKNKFIWEGEPDDMILAFEQKGYIFLGGSDTR